MPFPPAAMPLPAAHSRLPLQGLTVLLVEDSRFTSDALRLICQRSGARLRRADTLAAARAHLRCYRPDVVIIDLGLPDGRGEELIAELSGKDAVVLGMSGDPAGRQVALAAGAHAFLDKPAGSVSAFQRLILRLVAGNGAAMMPTTDLPVAGDPLALRDDLSMAADLVAQREADSSYATGFLRSLARASGDAALEQAAGLAGTAPGRDALSRLLADRLARLDPAP